MPQLHMNPTPVDLIFILTQRDYVMLESCTSSDLKMGMVVLVCVTKVLEIHAFLRHRVAKKLRTIIVPGETLQWQYFYKCKVLHTENKTVVQTPEHKKQINMGM